MIKVNSHVSRDTPVAASRVARSTTKQMLPAMCGSAHEKIINAIKLTELITHDSYKSAFWKELKIKISFFNIELLSRYDRCKINLS